MLYGLVKYRLCNERCSV